MLSSSHHQCFAKEPQYHPAGSSYIGKYKNMIAKYIYLAYKWHIEKVFLHNITLNDITKEQLKSN